MIQKTTHWQTILRGRWLSILLLLGPLTGWGQTQTPTTLTPISLGTAAYIQDFNTLASTAASTSSTVPAGFGFVETGTAANSTYTAVTTTATSSPSTGDNYSFGFGASATTDRAFGSVLSGSLTPQFGFAFTNTTGSTITSLAISYTGEVYRLMGASSPRNASDRLDFQYSTTATSLAAGTFTDVDALDYVGPVNTNTTSTGYDGNAAANRSAISGTISGLSIAAGSTFYIRFSDFNAAGADDGLAIDDFSITATVAPVCNAPTGLTAGTITNTTATVSFTGSASAANGYSVTTTPATTTQNLSAGATSVSFSGLTAGTLYTVSIVSKCSATLNSSAATLDFTTTNTATNCNAPTSLSASNVTNTSADVSFTGSASAANGYTVTTSPATTTQTLGAGATSVSFSGLTAGTLYTVSIVSNCANSAVSGAATVDFTTTSTCAVPTGLTAGSITNTSATVSFTGSASATGGYTVTTSPATTTQTLGAGATSVSFSGLTAGTAYTVSIVSNCDGGATAAATTTFTTTSVCAAPTNLMSANVTTTSADVTFTGSSSATGYTVTTSPTTTTQTLAASATSVSFAGLTAGTAYTVSIVSNCAGGATATAATTTFTTATPSVPSVSIAAVNTAYAENFNTLATAGTNNSISTLPLGWTFLEMDTNANTTYRADDGNSNTADTFSFGTGTSTDRAFGTLASGSLQSSIGAAYTNNTAVPITSLLISYTGEQWRTGGSNNTDELTFSYSTGGGTFATATYTAYPALKFVSPVITNTASARNGNVAPYRTALTSTITGLNIAPGATFYIRWDDPNITGNDDGLAIDDFSLTANPTPPACGAPSIVNIGSITTTTASVTLAPGPNGSAPFSVTATPATGPVVTGGGASPVNLTGLTPGTTYSVTATSICNVNFSSPSATSTAVTLTTLAAPTASLAVTQGSTSYPSGGTAYAFGNQTLATTSAPVAFTLTNSGTAALTISSISTTGNFAVSGTAPTTVAAGGTATVSVTFTPTATGPRTGTLVINSDATTGTTYTVNLSGNGTAVPVPVISVVQGSTPYANGSTFSGFVPTAVGSFSNVTFTLQNTGTAPLTITGLAPGGADFATTTGTGGPALPFDIAAGGSATFVVIFGPTATGTRTGTVTVSSNSATNSSYLINLSGQERLPR